MAGAGEIPLFVLQEISNDNLNFTRPDHNTPHANVRANAIQTEITIQVCFIEKIDSIPPHHPAGCDPSCPVWWLGNLHAGFREGR